MSSSLLFPRHRSRSFPLESFLELVRSEIAGNPLYR
jgi:hypothetical protein